MTNDESNSNDEVQMTKRKQAGAFVSSFGHSSFELAGKKHPGRRGAPVSLAPLTMDQAVDAIFAIGPEDVEKIIACKPGKGKKSDSQ
jgi:hypothetical protein